MTDDALNILVGGHAADRLAYVQLVWRHQKGIERIDPRQWSGWPKPLFDNFGLRRYEGVW